MSLVVSFATQANPKLTFGYSHFPPLAYTNEVTQEMEGKSAPLVEYCLKQLGHDYAKVELPVNRYKMNLKSGDTHIALGNSKIDDMATSSYIGKTLIHNTTITVYSLQKEYKKLSDFREKRLGLNKFFNYMGYRDKVSAPEFNASILDYTKITQGIDLVRLKRIDGLMVYGTEVDLPDLNIDDLHQTPIIEFPVYFVVSKKTPNAEALLAKLDAAASEFLSMNGFVDD